MRLHTAIAITAIALTPAAAFAQSATERGAVDGAVTGGAVGGPVGAAVGGTVGAAVGAAVDIPGAVVTSVLGLNRPSVVYERPIVVGEPLPSQIEYYEVPGHAQYRYTVVNNRRYIVEPRSRRVVRVIE